MKKSLLLGLGVCALALGGVALSVNHNSLETRATGSAPSTIYLEIGSESIWNEWGCTTSSNLKFHFKNSSDADITTFPGTLVTKISSTYAKIDTPTGAAKLMISWNDGGTYQNQTVWTDIPTDGKNLVTVTGHEDANLQSVSWSTMPIELHEGCIYWRTVEDTDFYAYTYETIDDVEYKFYGDWRGLSVKKTATVVFNPVKGGWEKLGLIKIPFLYHNINNVSLIVNAAAGYQSKSLKITPSGSSEGALLNGAYYYSPDKNLWDDVGYNADMGTAAALVWDLEEARNAVVEDSENKIAAYSICGIPQSTVSSLVSRYSGLTATQKGYFDNATATTYSGEYGSSETAGIKFGDMMQVLSRKVATSNYYIPAMTAENDSFTFAVCLLSVSALALGGMLFIRKRKAQ